MFLYEWDFAGAQREFQKALALNADAVYSSGEYRDYLLAVGRFDDSRAATQRAYELDPLEPTTVVGFAVDSYWAGRYDEAIQPAHQVAQSDPNDPSAHLWLGLAYQQKRNFAPAIAELSKATQLSNDKAWVGLVAYALATSGDKPAVRKILRDMKVQSQNSYVSPWWFAIIYCGLGEKEQAFLWLERAYKDHEHDLVFSNRWPLLRPRSQIQRTDSPCWTSRMTCQLSTHA
jgi:adenylate cyclase